MIYRTADDWLNAPRKRVLLFGMSGLGKTHIAQMLRKDGAWYHYSVDYRIGTRYLGEAITDNLKQQAMAVPLLRELLLSNSIYIGSNLTFGDLAPLSSWLGKPGKPELGGLPFAEYQRRQDLHRQAEIAALLDTGHFISRAEALYGYEHFICDSGGSICEVINPDDPDDPVLKHLSETLLLVWIKGAEAQTEALIRRFDKAPKPMYYHPDQLLTLWGEYLNKFNIQEDEVNPDEFVRWAYARALSHRHPLYEGMSRWGVTIDAADVAKLQSPEDFNALIATALRT